MRPGKELKVAIKAAKAAGKVIMKHYGKTQNITKKSDRLGIVTQADFASQRKIKSVIRSSFKDAKFIAEEDKTHSYSLQTAWIVDPIDGTTNFSRGIKFFCVSIALLKNRKISSGVVFNPITKDLFFAESGKGAFLNGKRIRCSSAAKMVDSNFVIGLPHRKSVESENLALLKKLFPQIGNFRDFASAALELSMLAAGQIDGYLEVGLFPWDSAAGVLLVREAGGKATNGKGKQFDIFEDKLIVASNGKLHRQVIEAIK